MKIIKLGSQKFIFIVFIICIIIILLINIIGYVLDNKYISVIAAIAQVNKYEVRSQLLMDAMNSVGACEAKDAALVWASGLKERNAALQYSVMIASLKEEYAKQLESTFPNWVTGVSSPWIESYEIVITEAPTLEIKTFLIKFTTMTSTGPAGDYYAQLTIEHEEQYWRITRISMDDELYVYTGFKNK